MTSPLVDLPREQARQADGRFGRPLLAESDVDLDLDLSLSRCDTDGETGAYDWATDDLHDEHQADIDFDELVSRWNERREIPRPRLPTESLDLPAVVNPDLVTRIDENRQERALAELDNAAVEEPATKRWHERFLDVALRMTAPANHFTLKHAVRTAVLKGGLVLAAIASFAIPAEYGGGPGLGVREMTRPPAISPYQVRYNEIALAYDCTAQGLPEGVIPAHAILYVRNNSFAGKVELVSFDKGWEAHVDKTDNAELIAVCRD